MKTVLMAMDSSGDTRVEFDETDVKAKAEAQALFERMTAKGARAFRTDGTPGPIKDFNEVQGEVVLVPRRVGG